MGGLTSRLWVQFRGSCSDLPCWELGDCFLSLGALSGGVWESRKFFCLEHIKSTHPTDSFPMKSLTWCFSYVLSSVNSLLLLYKPQHSGLKQQFINKHDNSVCWLVSARKQSWICSQMQAAQGYRAESELTVYGSLTWLALDVGHWLRLPASRCHATLCGLDFSENEGEALRGSASRASFPRGPGGR